jgi:hypothetical protein
MVIVLVFRTAYIFVQECVIRSMDYRGLSCCCVSRQ